MYWVCVYCLTDGFVDFLIDPLKNIEDDSVHFDFIDELSPGVIRYNKPFLYVIMPMRTA